MFYEERVTWAINWIKNERKLNNQQLAKMWEVDKNTVAAYCKGEGIVKGAALASIVKDFGINGEWLIAGWGEPFPGARTNYSAVCGPEKHISDIQISLPDQPEKSPIPAFIAEPRKPYKYDKTPDIPAQFSPHDAIGMASVVLNSDTSYAYALYLNIVHFERAIRAENRIAALEDKCEKLENKVMELIETVKGMQRRDEDTEKGSSAGAS